MQNFMARYPTASGEGDSEQGEDDVELQAGLVEPMYIEWSHIC